MDLRRTLPIIVAVGAVAVALFWSRGDVEASGASSSIAPRDDVESHSAAAWSATTEPATTPHSNGSPFPDVDDTSVIEVDGEFPDPAVVRTSTGYVAYATNITAAGVLINVPTRSSANLMSWSAIVDAMPELPVWAQPGQTWAPSVIERDGHYELHFSALDRSSGRQCIGVATSDEPLGPFESTAEEPLVCAPTLGGAIDPEMVVVAGRTYLLWKNDGNCCDKAVRLWAQEVVGPSLVGTASVILEADASWEHGVVENPTIVVEDGTIVLLYSGGKWDTAGYGTGYAVCADLQSRCSKRSRSGPALDDAPGTSGSGGASVFHALDGTTWLAWHAWPESRSHDSYRSMAVAPMRLEL